MKNVEEQNRILNQIETKEDSAIVLEMIERGEVLGYVAVDILEDTLRYLKFQVYSDPNFTNGSMTEMFMDSLMRCGASYGETKGATKLSTLSNEYNSFFNKKGFDTDGEHAFAKMSLIVRYK